MSRPPFSELKLYNWSRPDTVGHAVVNLVPSCNLGFTFLSVFRLIIRSVSWISFSFHPHQRRTAKLNCLSLRRWTTLAMPGWQAPRLAPWMATPTRAGGTFSSWNSMPGACTSGRASAVGKALTMLRLCRRTGCEVVFESFPLRKSFRFSCEVPCSESGGMASHSNWPICWVPLQGRYHDNSRYLIYPASREVSRGTLSDYFRL